MRYNNYKKNKSKKAVFFGFLSFILALMLAASSFYFLFYKDKQVKADTDNSLNDGLVIDSVVGIFNAAVVGDTTILTATILPANATNKLVDWSANWEDKTGWAGNKSVADYLTLTPNSDGSTSAQLKCLQAFATPIIIEVKSRSDETKTASCKVDFKQKITDVELVLSANGFANSQKIATGQTHSAFEILSDTQLKTTDITIYRTLSTIWPEIKTTVSLELNPEFITHASSYGVSVTSKTTAFFTNTGYFYNGSGTFNFDSSIFSKIMTSTSAVGTTAFYEAVESFKNKGMLRFKFDVKDTATNVSEFIGYSYVKIPPAFAEIKIQSMTLDEANIIF